MTDALTDEELSVQIARRLFPEHGGQFGLYPEPYASDHNAALGLVVPEMRKRGYEFAIEDLIGEMEPAPVSKAYFVSHDGRGIVAIAKAPFGEEPRAICLATLAALDAEEGQG